MSNVCTIFQLDQNTNCFSLILHESLLKLLAPFFWRFVCLQLLLYYFIYFWYLCKLSKLWELLTCLKVSNVSFFLRHIYLLFIILSLWCFWYFCEFNELWVHFIIPKSDCWWSHVSKYIAAFSLNLLVVTCLCLYHPFVLILELSLLHFYYVLKKLYQWSLITFHVFLKKYWSSFYDSPIFSKHGNI